MHIKIWTSVDRPLDICNRKKGLFLLNLLWSITQYSIEGAFRVS